MPTIPDGKFPVAVALMRHGRRARTYVFIHTLGGPAHLEKWEKVEGANILLVGDCREALKGLLLNYTNEELGEILGMHPTQIAHSARHLGIDRYPKGKRGGSRRKG